MATSARKPGRPKDEDLAERRHEEILRCAVRHFARVGYHALDLDELAAELGCAKGTVYRYFPTKQKLFEAAVDRAMTEMLQATRPDESIDLVDQLEAVWERALAFLDAHPDYVELLIQERAVFRDRSKPSFFEYAENRLRQWRRKFRGLTQAGRVRALPADSILDFGGNLMYGAIFTHYFTRRTKSCQEQAREFADVFLHGILTPAELARRHGRGGAVADSFPRPWGDEPKESQAGMPALPAAAADGAAVPPAKQRGRATRSGRASRSGRAARSGARAGRAKTL